MNEHLLQYIWLHRLFNTRFLESVDRQAILIHHPGIHNKDQGPDFLHARIQIDGLELVGTVEMHIKTSHWYAHAHSGDMHYSNVILHVVWEHDMDFEKSIPVLCLKGRVPLHILQHYELLMTKTKSIPCASQIHSVSPLVFSIWKERMFAERLMVKVDQIKQYLFQNQQNEEATFWRMIFRSMGMPVNADAFESVFVSIPFKTWLQCAKRIELLEALLLGQANLLADEFNDDYLMMLQREYVYMKKKFNLNAPDLLLSNLRMRPAHFPLIRFVQLATLIHKHPDLYSKMMVADDIRQMKSWLMVTPHEFWQSRYTLREISVNREKPIGVQMAELMLVNVVLPYRYFQAIQKGNISEQIKVIENFTKIKAEHNTCTRSWASLGVKSEHAFDAQALQHLTKNYCQSKRCLSCAIGKEILKVI